MTGIDGDLPSCNLMYAKLGSNHMSGSFSGEKTCAGNDSEPYQHFFYPLFLTKSRKIHWKHAPNLRPSTVTATFDSNLPI